MKIKIFKILLILIFTSIYLNTYAQTVFFDSKNIKIDTEDNMIYATEGIAKIPSKNLLNWLRSIKYDEQVFFDKFFCATRNSINCSICKLLSSNLISCTKNNPYSKSQKF